MTTRACSARRLHVPRPPATLDEHHVIPRAWQAFWSPGGVAAVVDLAGDVERPGGEIELERDHLWDPRTVTLCPNCHRAVHERIVQLMHGGGAGFDHVAPIARLALQRWQDAGGSIELLRQHGLWGEQ
jgi:hypothetical protein